MLLEGDNSQVVRSLASVLATKRLSGKYGGNLTMPTNKRGSHVTVPPLCSASKKLSENCNRSLIVQSIVSDTNLFGFVNELSPPKIPVDSYSDTVSVSVYDESEEVFMEASEDSFFVILLKRGSDFTPPQFASVDASTDRPKLSASRTAVDGSQVYQALLVSEYIIPDDRTAITFQLLPENISQCPQYLVVARMIHPPRISLKNGHFDFWAMLPSNTAECDVVNTTDPDNSKYLYTFFLNKTQLTTARAEELSKLGKIKLNQTAKSKLYIGYRQLNENELDQYTTSKEPPVPYPYRDQINNTAKSRIFLSSCLSTNGSNPTRWLLDECEVGSATTSRQTECLCRRPTTVTAGWQVLPNKLDFAYIFANMDFEKNATVYGTEIAIGVLFLLLFLWARRADLRDIEQLGVTPLAENDPMDEYLYELIVSTGRRPNAGTQSKINIILSGEFADTEAKILQDPYRPVLQRGQTNRFLLTCQGSLGPLLYCRLWHDNSVDLDGASWYCNHITVVDLQTRERVYCIVQRWFAVDEDDGLIDRLIPVSSGQEMNKLNRSFSENLSRGLSDEHLWLSVVSRPVTSRFTRVERVACCLTLLFLTMLTSGMFYRGEGAVKQPDLLSIGPFALSSSELLVAIISNAITFVPLFLVTYLFQNSRLHTMHVHNLRKVVETHLGEPLNNYEPGKSGVRVSPHQSNLDQLEIAHKQGKVMDRTCIWQMRIVAWVLLILTTLISALFTTFYGISFGNAACQKWLSALFLSFFTSVLFTQPITVTLRAMFLAFICNLVGKRGNLEALDEENLLIESIGRRYQLYKDQEYMHDDYLKGNFRPRKVILLPPDPADLEAARQYRLKQRRSKAMLWKLFLYMTFFSLLLAVTTEFRHPYAYPLKEHLEETFCSDNFFRIHKVEDLYAWVKATLIPGLRPKRWYNKAAPVFQRGFLQDRTNRIIGYAIMRQLRVKSGACNVYSKMEPVLRHCYASYSLFSQDEEPYGIGWTSFQGDASQNNSGPEFRYTSAHDLDGIPYRGKITWYSGGGYVHILRGTENEMIQRVTELESQHWIDERTRAVIVQFATYNPSTNLFTIVMILVEIPGTGTLIPSDRIEVADLFGSVNSQTLAQNITLKVLFVLFLIANIIKEVRHIFQQRLTYFRKFWNLVELSILTGSTCAVAAQIYVILSAQRAIEEFSRTQGKVFTNFMVLAYWNETLTYVAAIICFLASLKLLSIFQYNQRISLLGSVLRYAFQDMKYFFVAFSLMFMGFVLTFYFLYNDNLEDFRTVISCIESAFQIMLGKADMTRMYNMEVILGPLLFAAFTFFVIFVLVSMFIAILEDSIQHVKEDSALQSDVYELPKYAFALILQWTRLSQTKWGNSLVNGMRPKPRGRIIEESEQRLTYKLNQFTTMTEELLWYLQSMIAIDLVKVAESVNETVDGNNPNF
ncbi:hypothetical protein P879_03212 [Paragonimus westermani]|uniref:PLAT domain-containing protein n=1 Tax=Paragonimus westermani TaxID=34504 RepID=A0A8T0DHA4_9TREM|nr:hypothetical protein P879_03212 [Paragonimus westermani]